MMKSRTHIIVTTVIFFVLAGLLTICLSGCITINTSPESNNQNSQQNSQSNTQQQQGNANSSNLDGEQKAKSVAITDAGFSESQVNVTKCHLDYDDGIQKYEIDFVNGTNKYEYEIKADDFRIIKKEIDSIYD